MAKETTEKAVADLEAFFTRQNIAKAPAWMPEKGAVMVAEVIGMSMRTGDYGPYPVITYRKLDDQQIVNLHAFHTIIRERLAELKTDIGNIQVVTYLGMRDKNKPNAKGEIESYHDYYAENFNEEMAMPGKSNDFTFDPS